MTIPNASLKNQCAKNYFYGEDLNIEQKLQNIEKEYARIVKNVSGGLSNLTTRETSFLSSFAYLQYLRTDMAAKRLRIFHQNLGEAIGDGLARISHKSRRSCWFVQA